MRVERASKVAIIAHDVARIVDACGRAVVDCDAKRIKRSVVTAAVEEGMLLVQIVKIPSNDLAGVVDA